LFDEFSIDLDRKRIFTTAHPNPNSAEFLDNLEKLVRKRSLTESQGSNIPLCRFNSLLENNPFSRSNSLPEKLETIKDIEFDFPFQHTLFRTKSESFVD